LFLAGTGFVLFRRLRRMEFYPKSGKMAFERSEKLNADVKNWGSQTHTMLAQKLLGMGFRDRIAVARIKKMAKKAGETQPTEPPLIPNIKTKYKDRSGEIYSIRFSFPRHGIFVEHGVGRGRPITSSRRRPRPWLSVVIPNQVDRLADIIAADYADLAVRDIRFLIPGIFDVTTQIPR
jgi:hypothetical protein